MEIFSIFCCVKGSDRKKQVKKVPKLRIFSLKELQLATNNFYYGNKLGEGELSCVYWGQLWNGSQIAVRRFKSGSVKANREFTIEICILACVQHKNLLTARGYCIEGQELLIVYDFIKNRSLQSHLHGQHFAESHLNWNRRMNIAIGAAEGIVSLHSYATSPIIHRDIKASNVLLDGDFNAQIADFRCAKLMPDGATNERTNIKGSLGYLAPEYALYGKASEKCDVYSFGILLLELATGKKAAEKLDSKWKCIVLDWTLPLVCERKFNELADQRLNGNYVEEELKRVVFVGLACADVRPEKRPTMLEAVELLKGDNKEKFEALENDVEQLATDYLAAEDRLKEEKRVKLQPN